MLAIYLWFYTLFLAFIWWFFIVAKIHAYKFKNFSYHIVKVTKVLLTFLIILSVLWYILIFAFSSNNVTVKDFWSDSIEEINY